MLLYHITLRKHLESIAASGLIVNRFSGLGRYYGKRTKAVWLTDKPKHIIETQIGENSFNSKDWVVLTVEVDGLDWCRAMYRAPESNYIEYAFYEHEFWCSDIPSSHIIFDDTIFIHSKHMRKPITE